MTTSYDKHNRNENLFGEPYPELIKFFSNYPKRGKLLDLGCGQGRNAIIALCIQHIGNKVSILNETIDFQGILTRMLDIDFEYVFRDDQTNHISRTPHKMIIIEK